MTKEFPPIPAEWVQAMMPNLDYVDTDKDFFVNQNTGQLSSEAQLSWLAINSYAIQLLRSAEAASAHALSYWDFRVGGSALAFDPASGRMGRLNGFNIKPTVDGPLDIHVEPFLLEKVRYHGLSWIPILAICGEPNPRRPEETDFLLPCEDCEEILEAAPEITDSTVIVSGNRDFSSSVLYGLRDLRNLREGVSNDLQRMNLSSKALESRSYDEALMFLMLSVWVRRNPEAPWAREIKEWFDQGQLTSADA